MSIIYSTIAFTEPEKLSNWEPPHRAGIYAILIPDSNSKPRPFSVVYFGESENMSERGFASHHKRYCWVKKAGNENNLYVSTYLMPNSTKEQRTTIESQLVQTFRPSCND